MSYRLGDHTTADDATRYRSNDEVNQAWEAEPIKRLQSFLHHKKLWTPEQEQTLQKAVQQEIEAAVESYLTATPQVPTDMFDYVFEERPHSLSHQREQLLAKAALTGGHHHGH